MRTILHYIARINLAEKNCAPYHAIYGHALLSVPRPLFRH